MLTTSTGAPISLTPLSLADELSRKYSNSQEESVGCRLLVLIGFRAVFPSSYHQ